MLPLLAARSVTANTGRKGERLPCHTPLLVPKEVKSNLGTHKMYLTYGLRKTVLERIVMPRSDTLESKEEKRDSEHHHQVAARNLEFNERRMEN